MNDANDKFCQSCAAPLTAPLKKEPSTVTPATPPPATPAPAAVVLKEITCSCGVVNDIECKFCLECGENLQMIKAAALAAAASNVSTPPVVVVAPLESSESSAPVEVQCQVCRTWNEPGCKFCADCGETLVPQGSSGPPPVTPMKAGDSQPSRSEQTEQSATAIKCPKCRRPNAADMNFCRKCGYVLKGKKGSVLRLGVSEAPVSDSDTESSGKPKEQCQDCRKCGHSNPTSNIFCRKCGTRFAAEKPKPADEIAKLRRANSGFVAAPTKNVMKDRGIRCSDPACAKPNKPGDEKCRVCGKPLPKSVPPPITKAATVPAKINLPAAFAPKEAPKDKVAELKGRPKLEKMDSSAFLKKKDKADLTDQVESWLKRRDQGDGSMVQLKPTSAAAKMALLEAKQAAEKAAAEAKAAEEKKRKEEEEAAAEARRWVMPKLFIIIDNAIHPKRCVLEVHLKNPASQVIIDNKDVMWVWIGSKSSPEQATFAKDLVKFYCDIVLKESQRKAIIKEVKQREEAPEFLRLFQGWEYETEQPKRQMYHSLPTLPVVAEPSPAPTQGLSKSEVVVSIPEGIFERPAEGASVVDTNANSNVAGADVKPEGDAVAAVDKTTSGGVTLEKNGSSSDVAVAVASHVKPAVSHSLPVLHSSSMSIPSVHQPASVAIATIPAPVQVVPPPSGPAVPKGQAVLGMYLTYFPLERLQDPATLPPTLNMSSLETYLTDEDFQKAFKMTKDQFANIPAWKKVSLKKKNGLF